MLTQLHGAPGRRVVVALLVTAALAFACSKKKAQEASNERAAPVDPEAPAVVVAMIDAHGGMAAWRSAETVSFEDEFRGAADSAGTVSRVMVDQTRRRAYIDFPGTGQSIAWDGRRAWSTNWDQPYPPRFLALLNYYFLNLPWLTMDPGVKLAVAARDSLWGDPTPYHVVNMTFMPGTGDTPRDTYRLYIDPETKRLHACAYTVTYRALLPDTVNAMPEHILVYEDFTKADGLLVPTRYTIYSTDQQPLATCQIRDWSFGRPFDEERMAMPDSARIDESTP
jgi:hypothetical protein